MSEALPHLKAVLERTPRAPRSWLMFLDALITVGEPQRARGVLDQALRFGLRGHAFAAINDRIHRATASRDAAPGADGPTPAERARAVELADTGAPVAAIEFARTLIERYPRHALPRRILGTLLLISDRNDEALPILERAVTLPFADAEAHNSYGVALLGDGRLTAARAQLEQAIVLDPLCGFAHWNLANVLALSHEPSCTQPRARALALLPDTSTACMKRGVSLDRLGLARDAVRCFERAVTLDSGHVDAFVNMAEVLGRLGHSDAALAANRRAIALRPDMAAPHNNMGTVLAGLGRAHAAIASYEAAIRCRPDCAEAHINLATARMEVGDFAGAERAHATALNTQPVHPRFYSIYLMNCAYYGAVDPKTYLDRARAWETVCLPSRDAALGKGFGSRLTRRSGPLRVGYVSADFRDHAVRFFVEELFARHDRQRVHVTAYATNVRDDPQGRQLRERADRCVFLTALSDAAAIEQIRADEIDVLVDLSGHTSGNRLPIFAGRAAPVQVHYLGYCATTGLSQMDYWIGDDVVTPEWMSEQFSEIVWRLPRSWVSYADGDAVAPVGDADDAHPLTLGSFNSLKKLTPDTVALWARCLHALPGAELFLKTKQISDPAQRRRVEESFAAQGVDVARLRLDDGADTHARADHLAAYRRMDVALDPIGAMGGATTTCDALWMGVPVVTLAGSVPGARMSASMLHGAGHPGWVASDANEYVTKVCQLARDAGLRRSLRCDLRDQVRSQPLGDAAGLATALEDAFEEMFARWKH